MMPTRNSIKNMIRVEDMAGSMADPWQNIPLKIMKNEFEKFNFDSVKPSCFVTK